MIYGHDAGDIVLVEISERIRKLVQEGNMISRIGGEEFFVVLPKINPKQAEIIADKMRKDIEASPFIFPGKTEITVTC